MKDVPNIGQLITMEVPRDAIHIAVAPVTASETLHPGTPLRFAIRGNVELVSACKHAPSGAIGIVDPFLTEPVRKGESFWMFLMPNTITSLRHEWAHPAFDGNEKGIAEWWMRDFAQELELSYEELLHGAKHGEINLGFSTPDFSTEKMQKFWHYFEVLTGIKKDDHTDQIFSCAC